MICQFLLLNNLKQKQHTFNDDFNEWPASFRTWRDVAELAANTERQTPSQVKLWTALGTIPRGICNMKIVIFYVFNKIVSLISFDFTL